jgi:hypothetical protein
MVFAFCRTAPSVRFKAFATSAAGVFDFECALSARTSSFVQGARPRVFFLAISPVLLRDRSIVARYDTADASLARGARRLLFSARRLRAQRTLRERRIIVSDSLNRLTYSNGRGTSPQDHSH